MWPKLERLKCNYAIILFSQEKYKRKYSKCGYCKRGSTNVNLLSNTTTLTAIAEAASPARSLGSL